MSPATPTRRRGLQQLSVAALRSPAAATLLASSTPTARSFSVDQLLRKGSMDSFFLRGKEQDAKRERLLGSVLPAGGDRVGPLSLTVTESPADGPLEVKSSSFATGFNTLNIYLGLALLSMSFAIAQTGVLGGCRHDAPLSAAQASARWSNDGCACLLPACRRRSANAVRGNDVLHRHYHNPLLQHRAFDAQG